MINGNWQSAILLCLSDETGGKADMLTSTLGWNLKRRQGGSLEEEDTWR